MKILRDREEPTDDIGRAVDALERIESQLDGPGVPLASMIERTIEAYKATLP